MLEKHYRDMQDIEFTVQEGKFYLLQTRAGNRTGRASIKIAVDMVGEGVIDEKEALMRVSPKHVEAFLHPMVDAQAKTDTVAVGLPASPGGATGEVVFSADEAVAVAADGTHAPSSSATILASTMYSAALSVYPWRGLRPRKPTWERPTARTSVI